MAFGSRGCDFFYKVVGFFLFFKFIFFREEIDYRGESFCEKDLERFFVDDLFLL